MLWVVGTIFSGGVSVHRKFSSAPVNNLWKYGSSVAFILTVATLLSFGNKPNSRNDPLSVLEAAVVFGFWFAVIASVSWIWQQVRGSKSQDSQDLHKQANGAEEREHRKRDRPDENLDPVRDLF